jgi:hypothetical protein
MDLNKLHELGLVVLRLISLMKDLKGAIVNTLYSPRQAEKVKFLLSVYTWMTLSLLVMMN